MIALLAGGTSRACGAESLKQNGALSVAMFVHNGETQRVTLNDVAYERMMSPRFLAVPTSEPQRRAMVRALIRQAAWRSLAGLDGLARGMDRETTITAQLDARMDGYLAQRLKNEIMTQAPLPAESEIETYYTAHQAEFAQPERFTMQYVFSYCEDMNDPAKREAACKRIEEAMARIDAGVKFEDVAKQYSNSPSGNTGEPVGLEPGQFNPVIEQAVRGLADGAIGRVVETGNGYLIIHRIAHQPAGQMSLDEARDRIRVRLGERARSAHWDKFYQDLLGRLKPSLNGRELQKSIIADDAPVFRYADRVVTYGQVRPRLETLAKAGQRELKPEARSQAAEAIFNDMLLAHEARQRGLDQDKDFQDMRAQTLRDLIYQMDETEQLGRLSDEARVSDDEIERYYREHLDFFKTERQTKLKVIRVEVSATSRTGQADLGAKAAAYKKIESARRRLAGGEDIGALMKEFNGGWNGDWDFAPYGPRGHLIDRAVEKLKAGETGAPLEYENGFYLIHVAAAREPEQQPLGEVRDKIREIMRGAQARQRLEAAREQRLAECQFEIDENAMGQALEMLAPPKTDNKEKNP